MPSYRVLLFLVQSFFLQHISGIGAYAGYTEGIYGGTSYAAAPWDVASPYTGVPCVEHAIAYDPTVLVASHGPGLAVTSASPLAPAGVATVSETVYNGELAITGQVPFITAVTLEGPLPTIGVGATTYNCGNGNVAILNEDNVPPGYAAYTAPYDNAPYGYGTVAAGPAYGYGAEYGCGGVAAY